MWEFLSSLVTVQVTHKRKTFVFEILLNTEDALVCWTHKSIVLPDRFPYEHHHLP